VLRWDVARLAAALHLSVVVCRSRSMPSWDVAGLAVVLHLGVVIVDPALLCWDVVGADRRAASGPGGLPISVCAALGRCHPGLAVVLHLSVMVC
jgi:hypothetical protein